MTPITEAMTEIGRLRDELTEMRDSGRKAALKVELDSSLKSSDLPQPIQDKLGRRFSTLEFTSEELTEAIREEKEVLAQILPAVSASYAQVRFGDSPRDKIDKAMDGMFDGVDVDGVKRFRNIREAYSIVNRRPIFEVGAQEILSASGAPFDSAIAFLRETIKSDTWSNVFGTSITRQLLKEYRKPGYDEWKKVVSNIETLDTMKQQERVRTGGYGALASPTEGEDYADFTSPGDEKEVYTPTARGKLETITLQAIANDDLNAIRRVPRSMGFAARVGLYKEVFDIFTANSGVGPEMTYDTTKLFDAAGHANLGTSALSPATLTTALNAMLQQMEFVGSGETELSYIDVNPKYLLVPLVLRGTAWDIIMSPVKVQDTLYHAQQPNIHYKALEIIVVRHWTDPNNWYVVGDPALVSTIEVGFYGSREPQLFTELTNTGKQFTADSVRYKVRHIFGSSALEHRGMYGAVVA